jgi:hypothetical protein
VRTTFLHPAIHPPAELSRQILAALRHHGHRGRMVAVGQVSQSRKGRMSIILSLSLNDALHHEEPSARLRANYTF